MVEIKMKYYSFDDTNHFLKKILFVEKKINYCKFIASTKW